MAPEIFLGLLRYQCTVLLFLFFRSIMRINIRIGGNKKQGFSILFFFNLPNSNVGGSVNQSIIKKRPYFYMVQDFFYHVLFSLHDFFQ